MISPVLIGLTCYEIVVLAKFEKKYVIRPTFFNSWTTDTIRP